MLVSIFNSLKILSAIIIFTPTLNSKIPFWLSFIGIAMFFGFSVAEMLQTRRDTREPPRMGEGLENEAMVEEYLSKVLEYCYSKGLSPSVMKDEENKLVLVNFDEDAGTSEKIMDLDVPANDALTRKNFNVYLTSTMEKIDAVALQFVKKN